MSWAKHVSKWGIALCGLLLAASCGRSASTTGGDSNTHWLEECELDSDCGDLSCHCGVCTALCRTNGECRFLGAEAQCVLPATCGTSEARVCGLREAAEPGVGSIGGAGSEEAPGGGQGGALQGAELGGGGGGSEAAGGDDGTGMEGGGGAGSVSGLGGAGGEGGGDAMSGAGGVGITACENGGSSVLLQSGRQVCDCPAGTWGDACELTTKHLSTAGGEGCALRSDDTAVCWGSSLQTPPSGAFSSISARYNRACGLRPNGDIVCWGSRSADPVVTFGGPFAQVSVESSDVLALRVDGRVQPLFRGDNAGSLPQGRYARLVHGSEGACALKQDGQVDCIGNVSLPQGVLSERFVDLWISVQAWCGLNTAGDLKCWAAGADIGVPPTGAFTSISLESPCALRADGEVLCWSRDGLRTDIPPGPFVEVSGSCGLRSNGHVDCWDKPGPPSGRFRSVDVGEGDVCAVKLDGTPVCFGLGWAPPNVSPPAGEYKSVVGSRAVACTLDLAGHVACVYPASELVGSFQELWGVYGGVCALDTDGYAQCLKTWNVDPPVPEGKFVELSGAAGAVCGRREDGRLSCAGNTDQALVSEIPDEELSTFDLGRDFGCGLGRDGTAVCWPDYSIPGTPSVPFVQITVGSRACGLEPSGEIQCWGGDGSYDAQFSPPSGKFTQISYGDQYGCGIDENAGIQCWGSRTRPMQ